MIRFACPGCNTTFTVPTEKAGKVSKCPKCAASFMIPAPYAASPPPPQVVVPPPPPPPVVVSPPPPPPSANDPIEIQPCPKCQSRLSVLAGDLGSEIECPSCQATYTAVRADAPLPPGATYSPPPSSKLVQLGSGKGRKDDDDDEDDTPRRKRRRRRYDEDDEEDEPPPTPKRRKRTGGGRAPGTVRMTRIGPLSFGMTMALVSAILALMYGLFAVLLFGCLGAAFGSQLGDARIVGVLGVGVLMGLVYVLLYAVFALVGGFIGGVIFAFIYNTVAKMTGGIEMDLE